MTTSKEPRPPQQPDQIILDVQKRLAQVEEFFPVLESFQKKLEQKKKAAREVIKDKMKELHQLINKWEQRFLDTAKETLDDKIEVLRQQEEKLREIHKTMQDFLAKNKDGLKREYRRLDDTTDTSLEDTDEEMLSSADEEIRKQLEKIYSLQLPLKAEGVKNEEFNDNLQQEFGALLDETRKSLKRSCTFVGGIVRGYLRRGQKSDKWVNMIRRLEARTEVGEGQVAMIPNSKDTNPIFKDYVPRTFNAELNNKVWKVISDLFKYRHNQSLRVELSKSLSTHYANNPSEIEFYLLQLVNTMLNNKDFQTLEQFIMSQCQMSQHFALQAYLLVRSLGDTGSEKWKKRCRKVLKMMEMKIPTEEEQKQRHKDRVRGVVTERVQERRENETIVVKSSVEQYRNISLLNPNLNKLDRTQSSDSSTEKLLPSPQQKQQQSQSIEQQQQQKERPKQNDVSRISSSFVSTSTQQHPESAPQIPSTPVTLSLPSLLNNSQHPTPSNEPSNFSVSISSEAQNKFITENPIITISYNVVPFSKITENPPVTPTVISNMTVTNKSNSNVSPSFNVRDVTASMTESPFSQSQSHSQHSASSVISNVEPTKTSSPTNLLVCETQDTKSQDKETHDVTHRRNRDDSSHSISQKPQSTSESVCENSPSSGILSSTTTSAIMSTMTTTTTATSQPNTNRASGIQLFNTTTATPTNPSELKPPSSPLSSSGTLILPKALRIKGKEYFFEQIKFMDELIDVSRKLGLKFGDKDSYAPSLVTYLKEIEKYIDQGYAYIDDNEFRHKVLRIVIDECHPIPTYGRVLYYLVLEVLDIPTNYTREMADEYLKLTEYITQSSSRETETTPTLKPKETESAFGELFKDKRKRIKAKSNYGHLPNWNLKCFIIKHGDNVLQEQFVMQLINQFQRIWEEEGVPLTLTTYRIMAVSSQSGLIEVVPNAISIDKLKQKAKDDPTLFGFFKREWPDPKAFEQARQNFVSSLAAYSLVCYFLQIKDRHNANIMITSEGHIFHIDFGYLLSRTVKFEKAPFKLTEEFVEVMGGEKSKLFKDYTELCVRGFLAARKHYEKILLLVEMTLSEGGGIPCLEKESVVKNLRKRFCLEWNKNQCRDFVLKLITEARDNWRTTIYDTYQRILNDIY
jgi:hypothetical protein